MNQLFLPPWRPTVLASLLRSFPLSDRGDSVYRLPHARVVRCLSHLHAFFMWPFNTVWTKMMAEKSNRSWRLYIRGKRSYAAFVSSQIYENTFLVKSLLIKKATKMSDCPFQMTKKQFCRLQSNSKKLSSSKSEFICFIFIFIFICYHKNGMAAPLL